MHVVKALETGDREWNTGNIEEVTYESLPNLLNDINLYFQETQQTPKMDKYKGNYSEAHNNPTTEMKGKD